MQLIPTPDSVSLAAANVFDMLFRGGVADLRRTPARIIDEAPKRTIYRYLPPDDDLAHRALPLLLVPPLAAPAACFDLRRGCSLAEHMLQAGHRTYMVEYGHIAFSDRELGLEHWVDDIVPNAIRRVSEDNDGSPVQVLGWCLGGIMSLLALAADRTLPVQSIAMVASPFDFTRVRMFAPIRGMANVTNGMLGTALYRLLGGAPAPLVRRGFQLSSIDKYLTKPLAVLSHLDDRDFLAQIEAVDDFIANMHAYPGRTMGQLYHRFFRVNDLADGRLDLGDHQIELADVRVPVLSIAGSTDALAPRPAVHHVAELLTGAPDVRLETCPGGHLGVLTGRSAKRTTWPLLDGFFAAPHEDERHLRVVA
jgi:polyhydroxyalkanoate synthase